MKPFAFILRIFATLVVAVVVFFIEFIKGAWGEIRK